MLSGETIKCPRPLAADCDATAERPLSDEPVNDFDRYSSQQCISARYDPAIVYAVDEILTRGSYLMLARWFYSYINRSNHPGCVVIVGYGNQDPNRTVDLGDRVPYVTLNSTLEYPIFELIRFTGYPMVTILLTLQSSRLAHTLSCDGLIDVNPAHTVAKSSSRISQAINYVVERYLNDLYYDDHRHKRGSNLPTTGDDDGDEDTMDVCDDNDTDDKASVISRASSQASIVSRATTVHSTNYNGMQQSPSTEASIISVYPDSSPQPVPMRDMTQQNNRIMRQLQNADRALLQSSLYPDEHNGLHVVIERENA